MTPIERARKPESNPVKLSNLSNPRQRRVGQRKPLYGVGKNPSVQPVQPIFGPPPLPRRLGGEGVARARALERRRVGHAEAGGGQHE